MRILIPIASILISLSGLVSCSNAQDTHSPQSKEFETKTGKTIIITETHPIGQSLSNIEIKTKGFEHNRPEIYENVNPITDILMADLDNNEFDEIYIITTSQGSGSYGNVMGFASNKDKSLSMINIPKPEKGDNAFEGYMGHDSFTIENNKLVRTFPIYSKGDSNQNPTGGKRKLFYGLYPGEAMWQLKIEKSINLQ
jgi:hypothetical protein